jgi:hypothetical protein
VGSVKISSLIGFIIDRVSYAKTKGKASVGLPFLKLRFDGLACAELDQQQLADPHADARGDEHQHTQHEVDQGCNQLLGHVNPP